MLDSGIGRKCYFVERWHEFRNEDLGQEQRSRIEAEVMRGEPAAGDEDVGLALHEPEERAERHQAAVAREGGRAPEIEARPHHPARRDRHPDRAHGEQHDRRERSEEHTSELQSLMRISYAVFCLKKKKKQKQYRSYKLK